MNPWLGHSAINGAEYPSIHFEDLSIFPMYSPDIFPRYENNHRHGHFWNYPGSSRSRGDFQPEHLEERAPRCAGTRQTAVLLPAAAPAPAMYATLAGRPSVQLHVRLEGLGTAEGGAEAVDF